MRAKNAYTSIYNNQKGEDKIAAAKKIGACNKALNLPETDGLSN